MCRRIKPKSYLIASAFLENGKVEEKNKSANFKTFSSLRGIFFFKTLIYSLLFTTKTFLRSVLTNKIKSCDKDFSWKIFLQLESRVIKYLVTANQRKI